jgi:hypothetical protein
MKPLWDVFDGEPFMENPQLGILSLGNRPKRKRKKGVKMAVRRRKRTTHRRRGRKRAAPRVHRRVRRAAPRRRSRRRRNWAVSGMVTPINPRRRHRRSRRMSNPRRRHHRRRNPGFLSGGIAGFPIKSVLFTGIGFAGPSMVSGFLNSTFPSVMQQTTNLGIAGKYLVKIGSVLGLAWLTRRFVGSNEAHMVMIGGGANIALTLVNDFAPGVFPANPLGTYLPTVFPSMQQQAGMRAYVPMRGLRGVTSLNTPAAFPSFTSTGRGSPAIGGVAARFKRF